MLFQWLFWIFAPKTEGKTIESQDTLAADTAKSCRETALFFGTVRATSPNPSTMFQRTIDLYRSSFSGLSREVWLLSLVLLINRAGSMVIPFLTVFLTGQRGYSLQDAGVVMSSYGFGSIVGSYVGGWFTDRTGFYRVQLWTLIGSGLCFWVVGQLDTIVTMSIGIFVLSMVTDAFRPANQAAIAYFSTKDTLSRSYGLLRLAINLGFALGPVVGGWLIAGLGYAALFWANGLTCLFAAIAYKLSFPKRIESVQAAKDEEKAMDALPASDRSAYRDWLFLFFVLLISLQAIAFMQFFSVLPVYFKQDWQYTELQIGYLFTLNGLLIAAVEMPLVHVAERRARILPIIAFGGLLVGLSFVVLAGFGGSLWPAVFFIVIITFGEMLSMPFMNTWVAARAPIARRGEYMGLQSIAWALAFIIAPSFGLAWAERWGFEGLLWVMGAVGLLSGLGFLLVEKK